MPVQKQEISVNMITGADLKMNDQLNENFNNMENVVFTGDLVAKKMNGYQLTNTLQSVGEYVNLAKRDTEIVAINSNGAFASVVGQSALQNISNIGSIGVVEENLDFEHVAIGTTTRCIIKSNANKNTTLPSDVLYATFSNFYTVIIQDLEGNRLNSFQISLTSSTISISPLNQAEKLVNIGDTYYFFGAGINTAGTAGSCNLYKISSSGVTRLFDFYSNSLFADDGTYTKANLYTLDMVVDGSLIWIVAAKSWIQLDTSCSSIGFKVDTVGLTYSSFNPHGTGATPNAKNWQILNISSTQLQLVWCIATALGTDYNSTFIGTAVTQNTIYSCIVTKSSLAVSANTAGAVINMNSAYLNPDPAFICATWDAVNSQMQALLVHQIGGYFGFITGSILAHNDSFEIYKTNGQFIVGANPKSKPFYFNGNWMIFLKTNMSEKYSSVVCRVDDFSPQTNVLLGQNNFFFSINPVPYKQCRSFPEVQSYNGESYLISSNDTFSLIRISQSNIFNSSYIEHDKKIYNFGSIATMYDGQNYSELGFLHSPKILLPSFSTSSGGTLPADTYQMCAYYSWTDAFGDEHRSQTSDIVYQTTTGTTSSITFFISTPAITTKKNVLVKIFLRGNLFKFTQVYEITCALGLLSLSDPFIGNITLKSLPTNLSAFSGTTVAVSNYSPADLGHLAYVEQEVNNDVSVSSKCSAIHADRLFYVPTGDNKKLFYSKIKYPNLSFEFNQLFYKQVLDKSGQAEETIIAIKPMDGRMFIFKERSIFYIAGIGPAQDGTNDDFSDPQVISTDAGCINQRSIVLSPEGLFFKSDKGIYLLGRNLSVNYIGAAVELWNGNTITSATLLEKVNEIRFATLEGQTLVYNYYSKAWSWFTNMPLTSACMLNGSYLAISGLNVISESPVDNKMLGSFITQKMVSPWVHINKIQGYQKAYSLYIIGSYKTPHQLSVSVYYDYEQYTSEVHTITPLPQAQYNISSRPSDSDLQTGVSSNGVYQFKIDLVRKNCSSLKFMIEDLPVSLSTNTGECFSISNMSITIGVKSGASKTPANKNY
jgi:hypothetical protein